MNQAFDLDIFIFGSNLFVFVFLIVFVFLFFIVFHLQWEAGIVPSAISFVAGSKDVARRPVAHTARKLHCNDQHYKPCYKYGYNLNIEIYMILYLKVKNAHQQPAWQCKNIYYDPP